MKICAFYCSNNLDAGRLADFGEEVGGDTVKTISLPCSGKVDVPYLIKAFETGADGVVIVTCKKNECRHFEGNLRAHKRAEAVESLLEEIGMGAGRMAVIECAKDGAGQVLGEIKQFIERVRNLPPGRARSGAANETGKHGCMKVDSKLAKKIETGDFIVTAEHAPGATAAGSTTEAALKALGGKPVAVNMADNPHGVAMSSVAASVAAIKLGRRTGSPNGHPRPEPHRPPVRFAGSRQSGDQECALPVRLSSDADRLSGIRQRFRH